MVRETSLVSDPGPKPRVCLVGGPDIDKRLDLMAELASEYEFVGVGTNPNLAARFASCGFRYRSYRMSRGAAPSSDLLATLQLLLIFRSERPAIVHTFDTKPGVWGRVAARASGVPVVIGTLPGLGSLFSSPSRRGRVIRSIYQPLQRFASRLSTLTVFQNEDDAREFTRLGVVAADRITIVRGSGVRTDIFSPGEPGARARLRARLGFPKDRVVVLMISRILRSKGVLEFAAAARAVRGGHQGALFVLVGPHDPESLDALTPMELQDLRASVDWLGARDDVKELLEAADIFVFPSFYREGIPRVLLEAASMALPIVAMDVPGSREVIHEGKNGFLIQPGDGGAMSIAIGTLVTSPRLRMEFGQRSRALAVSQFDLGVVADATRSIYERALNV
jgi:glycosyltransferase involved in cell wall biosynthesis